MWASGGVVSGRWSDCEWMGLGGQVVLEVWVRWSCGSRWSRGPRWSPVGLGGPGGNE